MSVNVRRLKDSFKAVHFEKGVDVEAVIEEIQRLMPSHTVGEGYGFGAGDIEVFGWDHEDEWRTVTLSEGNWLVVRGDGKFAALRADEFTHKYVAD